MNILFSVEDLFIVEPLGIMQMAAIAKKRGHRCYFSPYEKNDFMQVLKKVNPDVAAISIMSTSNNSCKSIIKKIKEYNKDIFVVVGGPHPTHYPDFINLCEADAICRGEGDGAFQDLLACLEEGRDFSTIENIGSKGLFSPIRGLVEDLDSLPFADRELVYNSSHLGKGKLKSFMATRGCPYSCTYCFNSGYKELYKGKGKILRRRSVANLIEEIKMVRADFPLEIIRFGDDVFIERMDDWFFAFVDKYRREVDLPFYCLLSPRVVTEDLAKRLKNAGCVSVAMSIETGNENMRYEVLQRRISDDEIIKACRTLVTSGIKTFTNIMVGLPQATILDELKSIDLAIKGKTTYASFTIFTPFPGTALHARCVQDKLIPQEYMSVFPKSTTDRSILSCFTEKDKDIQKNIMLLGSLASGSKILRWPVLKWLIYLKPNKIYFYISFIVRNYYHYRHIWPMSLNIKEFFRYVRMVFKHDRKYVG